MTRVVRLLSVLAFAAGLLAWPATAKGAIGQQSSVWTYSVDPQSGPAGAAIAVSGQCINAVGQAADAWHASLQGPTSNDSVQGVPDGQGSFAGTLILSDTLPPGTYDLFVGASVEGDLLCGGASVPFTVTTEPPIDRPNVWTYTVEPRSGPPGATVTVAGQCVTAAGAVADEWSATLARRYYPSYVVGRAAGVTGSDGTFSGSFVIEPPNAVPGDYTLDLRATVQGAICQWATLPFTLTAAVVEPAEPVETEPAFTG